jgi:hypothetical protein
MSVGLALLELPVLLQPREDSRVSLLLRQPGEVARFVVHAPVRADHGQLREPVVAADLVVERIVPGRDLERARCEFSLDAFVRDDGDAPFDVGHDHFAADDVAIPLVLRVHGHGNVSEDRRRPHGRDRDVPVAVREGIADVREHVVDVDVRDL